MTVRQAIDMLFQMEDLDEQIIITVMDKSLFDGEWARLHNDNPLSEEFPVPKEIWNTAVADWHVDTQYIWEEVIGALLKQYYATLQSADDKYNHDNNGGK